MTRRPVLEVATAAVICILVAATLDNAWGALPLGLLVAYWLGVARGKGVKASEFAGIQVEDRDLCPRCREKHKGVAMLEHWLANHSEEDRA